MKAKTITAYRFFDVSANGTIESHIGDLTWPAPKNRKPGAWVKHKGPVKICAKGLHASPTVRDALRCRQGATLGTVEAKDIVDAHEDKFVCREMRIITIHSWKHLVALAFVAGVRALPIFEKRFAGDERSRKALEEVLVYLRAGDKERLRSAAYAASAYADADAYARAYADAAYAAFAAAYAARAYADADAYEAAAYAADAYEAAYAKAAYRPWLESAASLILATPKHGLADVCEAIWMEVEVSVK